MHAQVAGAAGIANSPTATAALGTSATRASSASANRWASRALTAATCVPHASRSKVELTHFSWGSDAGVALPPAGSKSGGALAPKKAIGPPGRVQPPRVAAQSLLDFADTLHAHSQRTGDGAPDSKLRVHANSWRPSSRQLIRTSN